MVWGHTITAMDSGWIAMHYWLVLLVRILTHFKRPLTFSYKSLEHSLNSLAPGSCGSNFTSHSGENDDANCSWLHPVWPPPKRPDQDNTFCVVSGASTELIFCIHRDFDLKDNVCKPRRLVSECCRDISAWKSRVMMPTVLGDEANCWGALA